MSSGSDYWSVRPPQGAPLPAYVLLPPPHPGAVSCCSGSAVSFMLSRVGGGAKLYEIRTLNLQNTSDWFYPPGLLGSAPGCVGAELFFAFNTDGAGTFIQTTPTWRKDMPRPYA